MTPLAHIAGIPVEETALSFGPVLLAGGGIVGLKIREWLGRGPADQGREAERSSSFRIDVDEDPARQDAGHREDHDH